MKTWIVSSLDEATIQGEETIQGRKIYEEIWYFDFQMKIHLEQVKTNGTFCEKKIGIHRFKIGCAMSRAC